MDHKQRLGMIGVGHIGGALARQFALAGHPLLLASDHPDRLHGLAADLSGAHGEVRTGTPEEAVAFGDVLVLSVPLGAVPGLGSALGAGLRDKIVLDTCNPYPERDGQDGVEARAAAAGSGAWDAAHLPGARVVKAFNTIPAAHLRKDAFRSPERIAVPLAGDDRAALETASRLVLAAGFDPVVVGPLATAKRFDVGTAVYGKTLTARELRARLGDGRPWGPGGGDGPEPHGGGRRGAHFAEAHG